MPPNVVSTVTVGSRFLHYVHQYKIKSKNTSISLIFDQFDQNTWRFIVIFLFILMILLIFVNQMKSKKISFFNLKLITNSIINILTFLMQSKIPEQFSRLNKLSVIIIFIGFYQITNLFIILIRTDAFIVDTSSIMNNFNQIIESINNPRSGFKPCWLKTDLQV